MFNFINKKSRFENCLYILFCLIGLIYGLITSFSSDLSGIRIICSNTTGLILQIVSGLLLVAEIVLLLVVKNQKIKRILYLVTIVIVTLVVVDFLVLGIVRSFVTASSLTKAEAATMGLNIRLAYICLKNYSSILMGVWTTIWLSLAGTVIGLILGLLFITLRTLEVTSKDNEFVAFLKKIGCGFVKIYVTVFRGTPMMVQAIIIYYFLPGILANLLNIEQGILNSILSVGVAGLITVSLNTTAYLTEVLRGGIESLNKGQMEAARSLGMPRSKAMFYVILPQGIKNSLPAICNEFIINIKDTSVLSVISVMDLFFIIDMINGKNANSDAIFIAAIIYLCLTYGISKLLGVIEKRMNLIAKPLPSSN
ncbi:MAG: amino acid ABC transporter permease [Bacilli bacterium]|nr:amino acid ABC transporter permease [Bacilli bacterium]